MSILDRIQALPKGKKKALREKVGVSRQTLYDYQTGKGASVDTAKALASALGCPSRWAEFFPKAESKPNQKKEKPNV
jgi:transcriptional regulator with XRE-family HTH domain